MATLTGNTGVIRNTTGGSSNEWRLGDWLNVGSDPVANYITMTNTIFTAYSLSLFSRMAAVVGNTSDASTWAGRAQQIVDSIKYTYRQADGRLLYPTNGERQTPYAQMISFGLDKGNNALYAQKLADNIRASNGLTTGFAGTGGLLPSLSNNGQVEAAFALLEAETYPSWIYCINMGATTAWERWNSFTTSGYGSSGMNSFNHYAFGSVGEWLMSGMLGIHRDESSALTAGFRHFILNPQYGGTITYAKGHYDSMSGRIVSDWVLNDMTGGFTYNCTIPANTSATIYLPAGSIEDAANVTEGGLPLDEAEGVTVGAYDAVNKRLTLEVASGSYSFATSIGVPVRSRTISVTSLTADAYVNFSATQSGATSRAAYSDNTVALNSTLTLTVDGNRPFSISVAPCNTADFYLSSLVDSAGNAVDPNLSVDSMEDNLALRATFTRIPSTNIAAGVTPTVTSPLTSGGAPNNAEWRASNLTDGTLSFRNNPNRNGWTSDIVNSASITPAANRWGNDGAMGSGIPVTLTFNLGTNVANRTFNQIRLYPRTSVFAADGGTAGFPRDFTIEGSNTSATAGFTPIMTLTDKRADVCAPLVVSFDTAQSGYQWLRISCTRLGLPAHDDGGGANYRMQLSQIGFFNIRSLTVLNGTGSGVYTVGAQTAVTADPPLAGYVFDEWVATGFTLVEPQLSSASFTLTIPNSAASNITLEATYKKDISIDDRIVITSTFVPDESDPNFNPGFKLKANDNIGVVLCVAAYDASGKLVALDFERVSLTAGAKSVLSASVPYTNKTFKYKFFIWDAQYIPLTTVTDISGL